MLGMSPQSPVNTTVGSDIQVAIGWTITPRVAPLFGVCGVYASELGRGGTFNATIVGTTARTYITLYSSTGPFGALGINSVVGEQHIAMLWE